MIQYKQTSLCQKTKMSLYKEILSTKNKHLLSNKPNKIFPHKYY